jgi:hypothetical protein
MLSANVHFVSCTLISPSFLYALVPNFLSPRSSLFWDVKQCYSIGGTKKISILLLSRKKRVGLPQNTLTLGFRFSLKSDGKSASVFRTVCN